MKHLRKSSCRCFFFLDSEFSQLGQLKTFREIMCYWDFSQDVTIAHGNKYRITFASAFNFELILSTKQRKWSRSIPKNRIKCLLQRSIEQVDFQKINAWITSDSDQWHLPSMNTEENYSKIKSIHIQTNFRKTNSTPDPVLTTRSVSN